MYALPWKDNTWCVCALHTYLHVRDFEHVCVCLHYPSCIRLREAQVWVCGCNQASFSSADSSFTRSVWSQLLHEQPIYYCCLATGSSLESFGPFSEITTKTLSLQNLRGGVRLTRHDIQLVFLSGWGRFQGWISFVIVFVRWGFFPQSVRAT